MSMFVYCPHCEHEQSDCLNGGYPREWWDGQDNEFQVECDSCKKEFIVKSSWSTEFETEKLEEDAESPNQKKKHKGVNP